MDGVMVNLDKKLQEIFGTEYKNVSPNVLWNTLGDIPDLFLNLEPMPNYLTLFNYLKQLESNGLIHLEILLIIWFSIQKIMIKIQYIRILF
jgi:hypothetical protein